MNYSVLFIAPNTGKDSGWGRYSSEILSRVAQKGFDMKVISEDKSSDYSLNTKHLSISGGSGIKNVIKNCFIVRKAAKSYQVVHALDFWPYGIYAWFAVLGTNKKLFISAVGTYSVKPEGNFFKKWLWTKGYKRASGVMAISQYTADRITKDLPVKNMEVVHLGTTYMPDGKESKEMAEATVDGRKPVVISVGALKFRKGQLETLKAINILKKSHKNILYLVVGSPSDTEYFNQMKKYSREKGLEKNVKFLPNIKTDDELSALYQVSDVLALNSVNKGNHFEGFGLVFLEGYQFGLPAVGSVDCGIEDAIIQGKTGYKANQKDPDSIAYAINQAFILKNKEEIKEIGASFDWEQTVDRYISMHLDSLT